MTNKTVSVSGAGFVAGLVTIFLPLLQVLPVHLSAGTVQTSVASGMGIIIAALIHHGVLTHAEITTAQKDLPAIESSPIFAELQSMADVEAKKLEAQGLALEARLEKKLPPEPLIAAPADGVSSP
jgi:hypothetical protein